MTKLSELLNEDSIKDIARSTVKVGDVFRIKMDKTNGITPLKKEMSREISFS